MKRNQNPSIALYFGFCFSDHNIGSISCRQNSFVEELLRYLVILEHCAKDFDYFNSLFPKLSRSDHRTLQTYVLATKQSDFPSSLLKLSQCFNQTVIGAFLRIIRTHFNPKEKQGDSKRLFANPVVAALCLSPVERAFLKSVRENHPHFFDCTSLLKLSKAEADRFGQALPGRGCFNDQAILGQAMFTKDCNSCPFFTSNPSKKIGPLGEVPGYAVVLFLRQLATRELVQSNHSFDVTGFGFETNLDWLLSTTIKHHARIGKDLQLEMLLSLNLALEHVHN